MYTLLTTKLVMVINKAHIKIINSKKKLFFFYFFLQIFICMSQAQSPDKGGGFASVSSFNPFRLSFSEPKCARGGHIIFLESIFQHSLHEFVIYSINRKIYNKIVNIL